MVGNKHKDRITEPLLILVLGEEFSECIINIAYTLMVERMALGIYTLILLRHHKGVVRSEGKHCREEGLLLLRKHLSHIIQELFVPDTPITIEIIRAVHLLIILATIEILYTRLACIGSEAHRAVIRTAEEHRLIALILQDGGQRAGLSHSLRHQHERRFERGNRTPHRRQSLNRTFAVGIHIIECIALAHKRVQEGGITLLLFIDIYIGAQQSRVLGRETLHNKQHYVATCKFRCRSTLGGAMLGRVNLGKRSLVKIFLIMQFTARRNGSEDTERIAQNHRGTGIVGRIECRVRDSNGTCHLGKATTHSANGKTHRQGQHHNTRNIIPHSGKDIFHLCTTAITPSQKGDKSHASQNDMQILRCKGHNQLQRVIVIGKEDLIGRETLLRIAEVDGITHIDYNQQQGIDHHVIPIHHPLPPTLFTQMQRHHRQKDKDGIGIEDRHGVELKRATEQAPPLLAGQRSDKFAIVEVEYHTAQHQYDVEQQDAPRRKKGI